jgi:phenylpropionate dioxygenase-like ring-hydroxylating dioxygenase large terminal subunit
MISTIALPAGDPQAPQRWYCAGWSSELTTRPVGRKLLGRHVVLFRDASGTARALSARCPHRGADLAQGSLIDGCIQCPFHGWRFDGVGQCVRVPSQPASMKISTLAKVPSLPLREHHGVLWTWMGDGAGDTHEPPPYPLVPPGRTPRRIDFAAELVPAPSPTVLENAFDKAHLPFIHRRTFGAKQDPLVARQRIRVEADGQSITAEDDPDSPWKPAPKLPAGLVGRLGRIVGLRPPVVQRTRFDTAGLLQIDIEYPNGTYDLFLTFLTPADERQTWLFVMSLRTRARHAVGDWVQRRTLERIFEEGKRETTLVLPAGPDAQARPLSVESDRLGLCARQLYERRWRDRSTPSSVQVRRP